MNQRETWIMHFIAGLNIVSLPTIGAAVFVSYEATQVVAAAACLANASYWLGRERRDHEIKHGIPAAGWHEGWRIWEWSLDGRMDLLTGWAGGLIPLGLTLLLV